MQFFPLALSGAFAATLVLAHPAAAAAGVSAETLADGLMDGIKSGQIRPAMESALKSIQENRRVDFDNLVQQVDNAVRMYGPMTKWELLKSEEKGSLLMKRVYISQHKMAPIFWTMYEYLSTDGWEIVLFTFDDKVTGQF